MEANIKIHKRSNRYAESYVGFGQYEKVYGPYCLGPKMLYKGYSYYISNNWDKVTCKHCLAKRVKENERKFIKRIK